METSRFMFNPVYQTNESAGGGGNGAAAEGEEGGGENDQAAGEDGKESKGLNLTPEQQAEFERQLLIRIKRETAKAAKDAAAAERKRIEDEAKSKSAEEQGDFKTLYEKEIERSKSFEEQIRIRDLNDLKREALEKHKLPAGMENRLQGETADEIEADAKALVKLIGPRDAPNTEGGSGRPGSTSSGASSTNGTQSEPVQAYTIDGRKKVPWPDRTPAR